MRTDEANKSPLALVVELYDKSIVITPDIENHPIIGNDAC